jgi:hypothetical protein
MTTLGDTFRQPEYTGENRCVPCTIVNTLIALLIAGGAALVAVQFTRPTLAGSLAAIVLGLSLTAIYLRGYLVPGTPTLTKRYLPERVLAWFDKAPEGETGLQADSVTESDEDTIEEIDPEEVLLEANAVEPCEHEDDLCLTEAFETAWWERIEQNREEVDVDGLADAIGIDGEPEIDQFGDAFVLMVEDQRIGQWESRAALVADVAAAHTLAEQYADWDRLGSQARGELLSGLRIFLESCPVCGDPVDIGQETVDSCCRSYEVVAASCESCEDRLLEVSV